MPDHDADVESSSPVWISFADLMTGLLGAFVLLLKLQFPVWPTFITG
jgi:hypothetical protein